MKYSSAWGGGDAGQGRTHTARPNPPWAAPKAGLKSRWFLGYGISSTLPASRRRTCSKALYAARRGVRIPGIAANSFGQG